MVKVKWDGTAWEVLPLKSKEGYYIDGYLKSNLDILRVHIKNDWDYILLVDGREGSGKSVLAQMTGKYLDPSLDIDRVVFTPEEFVDAVKVAKKYQCVIYDEAYAGLSSRGTMTELNKTIVRMLTEIRQKNLFIIIVMPCFFDLDKYVALWRSCALLHVRVENMNRGFFSFYTYNKKKSLYVTGKQYYNYARPAPNFYGSFTNQYVVSEVLYRKKKKESVDKITLQNESTTNKSKQRDKTILLLKEELAWTDEAIADKIGMSRRRVSEIIKNFRDS